MTPRVLLIMPLHREYQRYFPFGVATVYSILVERGFEVDLVDCDNEKKKIEDLIGPEKLSQYDIVGIGGLISCYRTVKHDIVPYIRKNAPESIIIIGGYLGTSIPDRLLNNRLCEAAFTGDAEESLPEFMQVFDKRDEWSKIKGISFIRDGSIVHTGHRVTTRLDEVHIPFHRHFDVEKYNSHLPADAKFYPLVVEIGCPFKCNFCFNSSQSQLRMRSPEAVIDEIASAQGKYGYRRMLLMAENILSNPRWVKRFCELRKKRGLEFSWAASGHANTINEEILLLVKEAGCTEIGIGFENFSQKILDRMNKRARVDSYPGIIKLFRKHGFKYSGSMIFGYFGEDGTTVEENARFMREYLLPFEYFWIQAYPMTTLYAQCIEMGIITDEERYIESLGDAKEFSINLTELTDEELSEKKQYLDRVARSLYWPSPGLFLRAMRHYGPLWLLRASFKWALSRIRGLTG